MNAASIFTAAFGPSVSVRWQVRSNYGLVVGLQNGAHAWVGKVPVPWMLEVLPVSDREREAQHINLVTQSFRAALLARQVPLPHQYDMTTHEGFALHRISDEGEDCAAIVKRDPMQLSTILRGIVHAIRGVLEDTRRGAGIDARLSNFTSRGHGVIYIDIFPPMVKTESGYIVHYPNPANPEVVATEVERKFGAVGILRRLRFDLMVVDPTWEDAFMDSLEALGEQLHRDVRRALADLPIARFKELSTAAERRAFLNTISSRDVDTLREIAASVIPLRGASRQALLDEVFVATSAAITTDEVERMERYRRYRAIVEKCF